MKCLQQFIVLHCFCFSCVLCLFLFVHHAGFCCVWSAQARVHVCVFMCVHALLYSIQCQVSIFASLSVSSLCFSYLFGSCFQTIWIVFFLDAGICLISTCWKHGPTKEGQVSISMMMLFARKVGIHQQCQ